AVGERLVVHVLVEGRELIVVARALVCAGAPEALEQRVLDPTHVVESSCERRQRQIPSAIMGNPRRIVERIRVGQQRIAAPDGLQGKVLMEPGDVSDLPDQRIDDVEARAEELLALEPSYQLQGTRTGIAQHVCQTFGRDGGGYGTFPGTFHGTSPGT